MLGARPRLRRASKAFKDRRRTFPRNKCATAEGARENRREGSRSRVPPPRALREEAVASDVEEEAFVGDGPADSADIMLVLFDDEHVMAGLGEIGGGRQPGGTGSDNQSVDR